MGLATQWLSENERVQAAVELLSAFTPKAAAGGQGRLVASCPFHSEKTPSFNYLAGPDYYYCFGCGASGDLIALHEKLGAWADPKEAFLAFKKRYAPPDSAEGRLDLARRKVRGSPPGLISRPWTPRELILPPPAWTERAGLFVEHSRERLKQSRTELQRLKRWGFDLAEAWLCGLGLNERWKKFPGQSWGLKADIILPPGLVIPYFDEAGRVIKIKIRRPEAEAEPRYWAVKGSANCLSLFGQSKKIMIVETERDAAMLYGRFRALGWSFCGTGSASARPCTREHEFLSQAHILAVALDNDKAGYAAWSKFWRLAYPSAKRWPLPLSWQVKDPGEAAERGLDLSLWLEACEEALNS